MWKKLIETENGTEGGSITILMSLTQAPFFLKKNLILYYITVLMSLTLGCIILKATEILIR